MTRFSPAVAFLIGKHQLQSSISQITASGPKGLLLKGDILNFLGSKSSTSSSTASKSIGNTLASTVGGFVQVPTFKLAVEKFGKLGIRDELSLIAALASSRTGVAEFATATTRKKGADLISYLASK